MAERPLYTLYKNLKAQNFDVPDDYDRFESALTRNGKDGADNRHAIYNNLKAQNFDVPDTYERFYSALFHPVSKDSSRANGGSVPMSAADKARFSAGASAISASAQQTINNVGRYNKLKQRKQKQKNDFGRVNIGTHKTPYGGDSNNIVKDDFAYNTETGKAGTYVTSDSEDANSLADAQQKQAVLDEQNNAYMEAVNSGEIPSALDVRDKNGNYDLQENIGKNGTYLTEEGAQNQLERKLQDAYARKEEIEKLMAEDDEKNGNPLLSYSASMGGGNGRNAKDSDYRNKLATSLSLVKQQIGALEAVKQYPTSSWGTDAWKALDNTAFTAKTWDFGLTDFATMGQMERIKTKMDNNIPLDASDKMLLKSKLGADAAAALEDEKMGKIYRWTKIAGQSLPFMADFFLTGGFGGITHAMERGALKFAAKRGMGKVSAAILKNTGIVAGDVIGSYAMAGTEQALKTGADIMQRHMGTLYQDENGNYAFGTFDENGNLLHEGGESFGKALYKGLTSAMVENYTEKLFGHNYGIKKGAIAAMEKHGMARTAEFFKNIGKKDWYRGSKKWMEKFGINGFGEEVMEEEIGIPLHALLDGDNKFSDLLDPKQQLDIIGGMAISVGSMYAMGAGTKPIKGVYNRAQYYRFKHKVNAADSEAQQLIGDGWANLKDKIDNTTNEKMGGVLAGILRQRDSMSKDQINSAIQYAVDLMKMRGYNIAKTAEMNAKELTGEQNTEQENHEEEIENNYAEGHETEGPETHDIQLEQNASATALANMLGISEEQLLNMSDEELEAMNGQNDKLDQAIYDYQMSTAKYQGVMDNANDKVDMAARQAALAVDQTTDTSRGTVRNATIKAPNGENDYGVYIISGNLVTHDDGSVDISGSDQMILYYDPKTGRKEYADPARFASVGDEVPAEDVKTEAVAAAKEKAIREVAGIIDGKVDVGSQFTVTDADGNEHTYEVLADNGDGTAAITLDGNVEQNPYSFKDLQALKDAEDEKKMVAARQQRAELEAQREQQKAEQKKKEEENLEKQNQLVSNLVDNDGNVVVAAVEGNEDADSFIVGEYNNKKTGAKKYKIVTLNADGTVSKPRFVDSSKVSVISTMSAEEYKQALNDTESSLMEDNRGEENTQIEEETDTNSTPTSIDTNEPEPSAEPNDSQDKDTNNSSSDKENNAPLTLEDGTVVPMLEDGNPDFSKLTAQQTAELYDTQFGEDADGIVSGFVTDAKKALDKAQGTKIKGNTFAEQKAAKAAKDKAIADAQARYDSAVAIRDAYQARITQRLLNESPEFRADYLQKAKNRYRRMVKKDMSYDEKAKIWNETVGEALHQLYDNTSVNVFDTEPRTVEEYVSSNIGPYSLNYEGKDNSKGVKQETGLSRSDFADSHVLAAEGKGETIDHVVHKLWENRPNQLDNASDQDIRNALIGLITSKMNAYDMQHVIENNRIAEAEKEIQDEKDNAENQRKLDEQKAAENAQLSNESNDLSNQSNDLSNETNEEEGENAAADSDEQLPSAETPSDATEEQPLGEQKSENDLPFSAKDNNEQETDEERQKNVERNKVDDTKVVDNVVGKKTRKALERIAKMMGAKIQWQYSDKVGNGWYDNSTNTIYLTLDSSITEGVQFIFGHEMTHEIKTKNPAAFEELKKLVIDTYGDEAYQKAIDETEKKYSDAGFGGRASEYYAEEVVADAIGGMMRDLNYAHTLAMKMSHPLLAKIHEIVNRIRMAFYGTEYTETAKQIMRSIEQAYVKTANGTFESSSNGERFSLKDNNINDVNSKFDNELQQQIEGKLEKGHIYKLGMPSSLLLSTGIPNLPIQLNSKRLNEKATNFWHDFDLNDVKGLVKAIQNPIAIFSYGNKEKAQNLVLEISKDGKNFIVGLSLNPIVGGKHLEINSIRNVFPKDNAEWLNWISQGKSLYLDKGKIQTLIDQQRTNLADVDYLDLDSVAKIIKDFENPSVSEEKLQDDEKFSLKVYHGSGADFTEFDFDHMGEGAGSQSFGWGGYVTSSKKIGKSYATLMDNDPTQREYRTKQHNAERLLNKYPTLEAFLNAPEIVANKKTKEEKVAYYNKALKDAEPYHNLYEVNIPDDNGGNYLDWDAPLSDEQKKAIGTALKERGVDVNAFAKQGFDLNKPYQYINHVSLPMMFNSLGVSKENRAKEISKFLSSVGFTGIKYKAGRNFGGAEEGDTNYVIFKPEDMKIAEHTKFSIRTYHGSQASFDHFDHSFMGSGEGAQAYGWGTYVSEVEGIAKTYAKQNARKHNDEYDEAVRAYNSAKKNYEFIRDSYEIQVERLKELEKNTPKDIEDSNRELEEAVKAGDTSKVEQIKADIDWFKETLKDARENVKYYEDVSLPNSKKSFETAKKEMEELKPVRNLYTVEIPDDTGDNYIGWDSVYRDDKLYSMLNKIGMALESKGIDLDKEYNQSASWNTWIERLKNEGEDWTPNVATGKEIYNKLSSMLGDNAYQGNQKAASLVLKDAGFDGVKVIAQRNTGGNKEGNMNYVIFDEDNAKITNHIKFSLKDNQGNPLNADGTLKLDKIKSVDDLTDEDFTNATRNVQLPSIPKNVDDAIGANGKPVIIKKNIFEKNWNAHKFTPSESRKVLSNALYNTDLVGRSQPTKKPNHWVAIKLDEKSPITVLEVNDNKDNVEVVGWYTLDERNFGRIKRQAERNGGELIMLSPNDKVESLSTPSLNSAAKIDNSSETSKENGEKFSLKDEKTMFGMHNISLDKLRKAIKQGGFAAPSMGVIDSKNGIYSGYGEITLIPKAEKIAKRTGKNIGTYAADAWTPIYPPVEKKFGGSGSEVAYNDIESVPKEMQSITRNAINSFMDGRDANSLAYLYLHEQNKEPELVHIEGKYPKELHDEVKNILGKSSSIYGTTDEQKEKLLELFIREVYDGNREEFDKDMKTIITRYEEFIKKRPNSNLAKNKQLDVDWMKEHGYDYGALARFVDGIQLDSENSGKVDTNATIRAAQQYISKNGLKNDYYLWKEKLNDRYDVEEVIFAGYKADGTRKYLPNTLENAVKVMKQDGKNASVGSASFSHFVASVLKPMGTLDQIRKKKGNLTGNYEDIEKFREKWQPVYDELSDKMQPNAGPFESYGMDRLEEAATQKNPKQYAKDEYGVNLTDEDISKLNELIDAIKNEKPSIYFETKFMRPYGLDEFEKAIVPKDTPKDVVDALKKAGIDVHTYEGKEDREKVTMDAINSSDDIKFSLKSMENKPEGWKQANKKAIHIAEAIERDPKFSLKNLDGTLIKAGTYFSGGGLVEEGLKGIIDPVVAVEYDEKISGVYRNNFGQHLVTADVRDVDPKELVKSIDGEVEYFHASPVCKNYSKAKANHEEVELDKETAQSTADFINEVKPKVVTIENVKGYRDSEAMKTITDALDKNGYKWDADVYNAADYGGYTNRERLIVRAVREGELPEKPKKMARKKGWYEAVEDIMPTLTEKKNGVAPWMDVRLKADGIDWRNIDKPLYVMGSAYANGKVPHAFADELLPTLRTKSGDVIVMPNGKVYRANGRVLARVSGVSDDYKMPYSEALSHTIIGNGIPTQLTEHVIAPLLISRDPKFSIRTYHGTGANFDAFDSSHAFEGEGSESFGHGVYVTNSEEIGAEYAKRAKERKIHTLNGLVVPDYALGKPNLKSVINMLGRRMSHGETFDDARQSIVKMLEEASEDLNKEKKDSSAVNRDFDEEIKELREDMDFLNNTTEDELKPKKKANRYDVEIPDDNRQNYLKWHGALPSSLDKNRIIQDVVKGARASDTYKGASDEYMKNVADDIASKINKAANGEQLYNTISWYVGDKNASKILSDNGIVGMKYRAGMIHGSAKENDYNYVIYKDSDAKIVGNTKFSLKQQKEKIVEDAKKNGNYMLAPNGKKTKLDAEQWSNVRTDNFKKWFGDWENDPENASKVVDENGEPMVVYHGRSTDFNTFEKKEGVRFVMGLEDKVKAEGFFFSPDKGLAEEFAGNAARHRGGKANVVPCFLNIRKPLDLVSEDYDKRYEDVTGWSWVVGMDSQDNLWEIMDEEGMADKMKDKGYDGAIFVEEVDDNYEPTKISYCALDANQIKSADNNNGEYSAENNDIRFSLRVDQFEHDLEQWKKDNNLPKDAIRPSIPIREPNESVADFLKRVKEYRNQMALWKTAPQYEGHLLSDDTAQGQFNLELQKSSVIARIALQDSMLAIRKAQEAIMKEVGVDKLNMAEDAYTAENRSHGKGKNEFEEYNDEFLQPLRKAYNDLMKKLGKSYDNVKVYMIAKHGLERNAQMAFKMALENDYEKQEERIKAYNDYKSDMDRLMNDGDYLGAKIDFTTWRQRDNAIRVKYAPSFLDYRYDKMGIAIDYSGLSALFDGSDFEEAAADLVKDVEDKHGHEAGVLWNTTNRATKKILRDGYKAGMMSKEVYEYVRDMYQNYIPLRGWSDTNADQVWNYVGGGKGAFNQTLKEAYGRGSLADDPIAYIENMAESGILLNNKNWVKQHLLLLAQNHPTSLLNVSKAWYVKTTDANGNEQWIPATPQITSGITSKQVAAALDAFQQKMEQLEQKGDATQKREHLEISYPQTNGEEREHEVRVMKDGEEYVIYVNGDPQLAQAMNNTRAHRVREGLENSISQKAIAWLGRKMAAAYTSLSPLFIPSNFFRDTTMTLASTAIREDARYNYLLRKNMLTHWNMYGMVRSYQNGKLREKVRNGKASKTEEMFYDFMMNGGETGFVSSLDVEDLKKKFKNELKDMNRMAINPKKVGHLIMDEIETLNRAIEDSNRFVVYMTSIQYGRSIDEAVNDAKDVTLNFNRKGTGEHGWQTIRNLYLFINPAVQSLQTLGALAKHHPFKFTAVTTAWLASGLLVPMINYALMSMFGGDDDKDKYWSFTKWDRRNNLIMWVPFTHNFVKIPLAQEFRGFYGVGDMIASKLWGGEKAEESWEDYGMDMLGQVVDMMPLDPTGYDGNIAVSLMPNPIRPMFELAFNVDFTGKPLFKDSEYNKYDPNFTKAYAGTPDWLVRISRMVNSVGNDYPDFQQNAIDSFGNPRFNLNNPAVVDHVLSSYLGGAYTMGSQILGVATKALNDPSEVKTADIPLISKFVGNPGDRPVTKKKGDEFWVTMERHDRAANTLSKLKKQAKVDGDYSTLEHFFGTEQYKQYKLDDKEVKKYQEEKKKEKADEMGDESYRPHKTTYNDIYKNHATAKDDFEDMKLSQLYSKVNAYNMAWKAMLDMVSSQADSYYNENAAAIQAAEDAKEIISEMNELKKGFLSDNGKDAWNAEDMKRIRDLRKEVLPILEKANKVLVERQKKAKKKK